MTRRRAGYRHIRPRWWQALLVSCTGECGAHRRGRIDELYRTLPGQCLGGLGGSGPHALEVARELLDAPGHRVPHRVARARLLDASDDRAIGVAAPGIAERPEPQLLQRLAVALEPGGTFYQRFLRAGELGVPGLDLGFPFGAQRVPHVERVAGEDAHQHVVDGHLP